MWNSCENGCKVLCNCYAYISEQYICIKMNNMRICISEIKSKNKYRRITSVHLTLILTIAGGICDYNDICICV